MSSVNTHLNLASSTDFQALSDRLRGVESARRQLASGSKVPTAADNPTLLSREIRLATRMRSNFAARININQSASLAQTADAHLATLNEPLFRLREMAVQAMSETLSMEDRALLQQEADLLVEAMKGIVTESSFNGKQMFTGDFLQEMSLTRGDAAGKSFLSLPNFRFDDTALTYAGDQDLVFLVDATGSMQSAIDALAADLQSFAESFIDDVSGGEVRISIIAYTDGKNAATPVNKPFEVVDFQTVTSEGSGYNQVGIGRLEAYLDNLTTSGSEEAIDQVIDYVTDNYQFRDNAKQQLIMIGSSGDEATNGVVEDLAVESAERFVSSGPNRSLSTISVNGTSSYFRDRLTPAGGGDFAVYSAGSSLSQILRGMTLSEVSGVDFLSKETSERSVAWVNYFMEAIEGARSDLAGYQIGLDHQLAMRESEAVTDEGVRGRLSSADVAELSTRLSRDLTQLNAHASMRGEMINAFGSSLLTMLDSLA